MLTWLPPPVVILSPACHSLSAGLDPASSLHKMKLLTLTSLAASSTEVDFSLVERELQIESSAVEQTVIDGVSVCLSVCLCM